MHVCINKQLIFFSKLVWRSISALSGKGLQDVFSFQMSVRARNIVWRATLVDVF